MGSQTYPDECGKYPVGAYKLLACSFFSIPNSSQQGTHVSVEVDCALGPLHETRDELGFGVLQTHHVTLRIADQRLRVVLGRVVLTDGMTLQEAASTGLRSTNSVSGKAHNLVAQAYFDGQSLDSSRHGGLPANPTWHRTNYVGPPRPIRRR